MVSIISIRSDYSTDRLMDWSFFLELNFKRINTDNQTSFSIDEMSNMNYIFFRKYKSPKITQINIGNYIRKEIKQCWIEFLEFSKNAIILGNGKLDDPSRINPLEIAQDVGLLIPHFLITTSKSDLISFIEKHNRVICKPLMAPPNLIIDKTDFGFRTAEVFYDDVKEINNFFYPTFFQKLIPRDYEVRLFYLKGKCYAMAFIIKGENETSPDIWNIKRRREVPILVPDEIQQKVKKFMEAMDYDIGSLDFIITGENWYFLELNPSGQYDFVSKSCNYFLDREIAKQLNEEYEKQKL